MTKIKMIRIIYIQSFFYESRNSITYKIKKLTIFLHLDVKLKKNILMVSHKVFPKVFLFYIIMYFFSFEH